MQSLDALRHVSSQVDRLIEAITSNGHRLGGGPAVGGGGASSPADAVVVQHFLHLASILQPQELFGAMVNSALAVTGAERGFLMMAEGSKLRFKGGVGIDQSTIASPQFGPVRQLIMQVLQAGQARRLAPQESGGRHVLCAPLKFGKRLDGNERVGGAVYVDASPGAAIADAQLQLLDQLAGQAAIALENAQIFQKGDQDRGQILRLKDNITKLYNVGQSLASTLILEDLLVLIVDHVVEISRAQRGFIMLLEGGGGEAEAKRLSFKVGRDARKRSLNEEHFKVSMTLAKRAIDQKKSQIMKEAIGADLSVSMVQMELQSIMCVPLTEKEDVIGIVYVDSQQSNKEFDESDLEIVESLCGQASVAIVNAKLYLEAGERERLSHELNIASRIQMDLLPKEIPQVAGLDMHGLLIPALEVGGDYYDFIPHEGSEDTVTIAIGDVSGKGVGAGLVMAMARSALRSLVQHEGVPSSPLPILRSLNVMLCRDIPRGMFMTLNILLWDAATRRLKYAAAGHEHLVIYRAATGAVEKIKAGGVAGGVLKQASAMYKEETLQLAPGDQVLLYTDGVTEAMDLLHQEFGLDTVVDLVKQHGGEDPHSLCQRLLDAIIEFRGEADPHDDITLVALKVR